VSASAGTSATGGTRPTTGTVEARTAAVDVDAKRIRGLIPYGVESRDLGGWREVIEPGAFASTSIDDLRAVIDHAGVPLGRYPNTLDVEDSADGLRWSVDPPESRSDVVEAIERGDMRAGSWRMVVSRDRWEGEVRHVEAISELKDVTIVGAETPAYEAALVEYRTTDGERRQKGATMDPQETGAASVESTESETTEPTTEDRTVEPAAAAPTTEPIPAGSLRVEGRVSAPRRRGLADEFRSAGFPGEIASVPWQTFEDRAVTWSPSVNLLNQVDRQGGAFPFDQRYAWTVLERNPVDSSVTSVSTFVQFSSDAATGVVRPNIASTADKAEVTTGLDLATTPLACVAAVESNIPTIVLAQPSVDRIINRDLAMVVNDGLDSLVVDTFAASGHQAPGSDQPLVSYRKAMTTLYADGYNPDTIILTPAAAEALDVLVTGLTNGSADFVFPAGGFSPDRVFSMRKIISKAVPSTTILDSRAYGQLYVSPAQLTTHEQDGGLTNKSRVRLELNAACGVERQDAAVRIAAS